ncbi:MAG: hypothetical protein Q9220_000545 [cf. Caloplaca sp. 1 TL-2023]
MASSRQADLSLFQQRNNESCFIRPLGPQHRCSGGASTETVLHSPQTPKGNTSPASQHTLSRSTTNESVGPRTVVTIPTGIPQVLGFSSGNASTTSFPTSSTQEAGWRLPDSVRNVLQYQAKQYAPTTPRERSFVKQALTQSRVFDPEDGPIYSHCSECDSNGGPTDCQHPEDPRRYSVNLNPIPQDDLAFQHTRHPHSVPPTPKSRTPSSKLISRPAPSKASVTTKADIKLSLSPPSDNRKAFQALNDCSRIKRDTNIQIAHPHEMLAARHLSNFLDQNVQEGVATSYIVFTTHGTLLAYSSPLPVTVARNISALTGLTWRANDQAVLRGADIGPIPGGASLLKTLEITKADKGRHNNNLDNMICKFKSFLMAVQWIQNGFLLAAMIESEHPSAAAAAEKGKGRFEVGADGEGDEGDEAWEDEGVAEEGTSENEDDGGTTTKLSKKEKLFAKSQGLADAIREQWKTNGFKMPAGFR